MPANDKIGILTNVDALIDAQLGLIFGQRFWKIGQAPHYAHRESCKLFKDFPAGFDLHCLASSILAAVAANYFKAGASHKTPSPQNWRCKQEQVIAKHNPSIEKRLEKEIVQSPLAKAWFNQIPVASGLCGSNVNRKNSIDLAWLPKSDLKSAAALIELKWESNTPAFAAFEILNYAIVYVFARKYLAEHYEKQELMTKQTILLTVLAPAKYFEGYKGLEALELSLDRAINCLAQQHFPKDQIRMGFRFMELPKSFRTPWTVEELAEAIDVLEKRFTAEFKRLN